MSCAADGESADHAGSPSNDKAIRHRESARPARIIETAKKSSSAAIATRRHDDQLAGEAISQNIAWLQPLARSFERQFRRSRDHIDATVFQRDRAV